MSKENQTKIEEITEKCLDCQGYLLFAARLTDRRDKEDRLLIDYDYHRFHFSIEDAKHALRELRKFVDEEIEALAAQGDEPDASV